jgi:hypothetical protein
MDSNLKIRTEWWRGHEDELDPVVADLEAERDENDTNLVVVHTYVDGRGSLSSYVLDRESARRFAVRLLMAAEV